MSQSQKGSIINIYMHHWLSELSNDEKSETLRFSLMTCEYIYSHKLILRSILEVHQDRVATILYFKQSQTVCNFHLKIWIWLEMQKKNKSWKVWLMKSQMQCPAAELSISAIQLSNLNRIMHSLSLAEAWLIY